MEAGTQNQEGQLRAAFRPRSERRTRAASPPRRETPRKSRLSFGGDEPPSAGIDSNSGEVASFYLGSRHRLIHRHTESMEIKPDQTARWTLTVDFELPRSPDARCGEHNDEALFLFPLLFLRKSQGRTGFEAQDEHRSVVPLLNRKDSDRISARAAARRAMKLIDEARAEQPDLPVLPQDSLEFVFERICRWPAYSASVILNQLLRGLDDRIVEIWDDDEVGLVEDLELLVDHSLVWVPLKGLPGERRVIEVAHDTELTRRPLFRWHFGEVKLPSRLRPWRRWQRAKQMEDPRQVLDTGLAKYGRTARRASLSVLGERLALPLGWMPFEFDFFTIYTRRCDSYHFEMNCPSGLKPRGVRVALDREVGKEDVAEISGKTTLGSRAAHLYLPAGRDVGDIVLRATLGIGSDAFPILWVLMGTITTMMLWSLVALDPGWLIGDSESHNEIAAGVLLIVPALLGALIVGSDERAESRLLSGARLLLLVTGLCCAGATAVLTDIEPFSTKPQATWAICAAIATAATIPLVTSWLLSLDAVWRGRETLKTVGRQWAALAVLGGLAAGLAYLLPRAGGDTIFRAGLASCLLLLSVMLILLASNRLPVALEANRKFLSVGAMLAAIGCLVLGCVELQRIFAPDATWQKDVERVEFGLLMLAPISGGLLWLVSRFFKPRRDELSVSVAVGHELVAGERIRELRRLRELASSGGDRFSDLPRPARRILRQTRELRPTRGLRWTREN